MTIEPSEDFAARFHGKTCGSGKRQPLLRKDEQKDVSIFLASPMAACRGGRPGGDPRGGNIFRGNPETGRVPDNVNDLSIAENLSCSRICPL